MAENDREIEQFRSMIEQSKRGVVFTGAGHSTESGIPDFRSPGGIWTKYKPIDFNDFMASEEIVEIDGFVFGPDTNPSISTISWHLKKCAGSHGAESLHPMP